MQNTTHTIKQNSADANKKIIMFAAIVACLVLAVIL